LAQKYNLCSKNEILLKNRIFARRTKLAWIASMSGLDWPDFFWAQLSKSCIFEQKIDFWAKFRFLSKSWIFEQNLDFWAKFRFLSKSWIFEQNLDFWAKVGFLSKLKFENCPVSSSLKMCLLLSSKKKENCPLKQIYWTLFARIGMSGFRIFFWQLRYPDIACDPCLKFIIPYFPYFRRLSTSI